MAGEAPWYVTAAMTKEKGDRALSYELLPQLAALVEWQVVWTRDRH